MEEMICWNSLVCHDVESQPAREVSRNVKDAGRLKWGSTIGRQPGLGACLIRAPSFSRDSARGRGSHCRAALAPCNRLFSPCKHAETPETQAVPTSWPAPSWPLAPHRQAEMCGRRAGRRGVGIRSYLSANDADGTA